MNAQAGKKGGEGKTVRYVGEGGDRKGAEKLLRKGGAMGKGHLLRRSRHGNV